MRWDNTLVHWLSCEEEFSTAGKPHGHVFEVNPRTSTNVEPIRSMGRFEHEAVCFDRDGLAYLTEDADGPHGCFYRFIPRILFGGPGGLHQGGKLSAMAVKGLKGLDLSAVKTEGIILPVAWVDVPNPDPKDDEIPVREQVIAKGATPLFPKAEEFGQAMMGLFGLFLVVATGLMPKMLMMLAQDCTADRFGSTILTSRPFS